MKSPFPGMDPFIEARGLWADFHSHLIETIHGALAEAVPERYVVRCGERSYVVLVGAEGKDRHPFVPDVRVFAAPARGRDAGSGRGAAVVDPAAEGGPIPMRPFIEEEIRETFVEVCDAERDSRLITCIEVLSPTNKVPNTPGWDLYLRKRQGLLLGEANFVEIDLLRGGERMPMLDPWPDSPYTVMVARPRAVPRCLVWPASFASPLPPVPVPLLRPAPDVSLDLQRMVEAIYSRSRYDRSIDYSLPLDPPPSAEQAAWVRRIVGGAASGESPPRRPRRRRS
jgi:hypothetical protein